MIRCLDSFCSKQISIDTLNEAVDDLQKSLADFENAIVQRDDEVYVVKVQNHFICESIKMQPFDRFTIADKIVYFEDQFYDTDNRDLIHLNWWLRKRDSRWSLKIAGMNVSELPHSVSCLEINEVKRILKFINEKLKKTYSSMREVENSLRNFATIPTLRCTFRLKDLSSCSLYLESIELKSKQFYLLGTFGVTKHLDAPVPIYPFVPHQPVSSKIVQYLRLEEPGLVEALVKENILPSTTILKNNLNLFHKDPFMEEPFCRFIQRPLPQQLRDRQIAELYEGVSLEELDEKEKTVYEALKNLLQTSSEAAYGHVNDNSDFL